MKKIRVDEYIHTHFNIGTIDTIQRYIMAGQVLNNNAPVYKSSELINPEKADIRFRNMKQYVSRGGQKLAHAIAHFSLDVAGTTMIDIGSSTGGFTDCALKSGVKHVYAVDVGTNQLDYRLRTEERVSVMEQTNFKDTAILDFERLPDIITIDVSFTSIIPIINHIEKLFKHKFILIGLIKPQFESYLEEAEDGGVITSKETHVNVIKRVAAHLESLGFAVLGLTQSPIKGTKGNVEYLVYAEYNSDRKTIINTSIIEETV